MKKMLIGVVIFLAVALVLVTFSDQFLPGDVPKDGGQFDCNFLQTSDTDRSETGELIDPSGKTITWTFTDTEMDALGDINLDISCSNRNLPGTGAYSFDGTLLFVHEYAAGAALLNRTDANTRFDVTYTGTQPANGVSWSQTGSEVHATFNSGATDQLNIDLRVNPTNAALHPAGLAVTVLKFTLGGHLLEVILAESA